MKKFVKSGLVLVILQRGKAMTAYSAAKTHERSMDEILESIRKVITDDMKQEHSEPTLAKVIELTQMVQEDGSIVDITNYKNKDSEASPMDTSSTSAQSSLESQEKTSQTSPSNQEDIDALFNAGTPEEAAGPFEEALESNSSQREEAPYQPENEASLFSEKNPSSFAETLSPSLISESVVQESLAAFSKLAEVVQSHPEGGEARICPPTQENMGQKSLEGLMRELLIPLLKDWLDANLPSLVKWIVTEEIQKILKQSHKG
jgi:cell pole-organizing protein PopZ